MLGLFGTINLASSSLQVQQNAMAVTGQNLANASNPAYATEQVNIEDNPAMETAAGEEGTGVNVQSITSLRNSLLDGQITAENSVTSSYTAQQTALQNAEGYLNEALASSSSGSATSPNGLAADINSLFNSFSSLSTNPSSQSLRQTVIEGAQQLSNQFNTVAANLQQVQSGLNTSVSNDVASANQDLNTIASLNQQIVLATASGEPAAQLQDSREAAVENLSGLANITTDAQPDGSLNVSIGGVTMVSGTSAVDSLQAYTDSTGNTMVQDQNGATPLTITGGSIGGNIAARDGGLAELQSNLNTLAGQLITTVNGVYSQGYDLNGNTGQNFFNGTDAATISVNQNVVNDPSQFQASGVAGNNGDNTITLALAQLANATQSGLGNQTFSGSYANTVSGLGNAIATVNDQLSTSQAISTSLTNERSSQSGVSIDQEMTNLMQYQKAYEASAQVVSSVNEMLQTVVDMPIA